uniref:Uncharacterized protein n=1 Tax=Arundo donax TaxID=35708 RepID=A0A0A8ZWN0_ARUDO
MRAYCGYAMNECISDIVMLCSSVILLCDLVHFILV